MEQEETRDSGPEPREPAPAETQPAVEAAASGPVSEEPPPLVSPEPRRTPFAVEHGPEPGMESPAYSAPALEPTSPSVEPIIESTAASESVTRPTLVAAASAPEAPSITSSSLVEPAPATSVAAPGQEPEPGANEPAVDPHPAGPNWMLAFVCAWAAATALNEAWAVMAPIGFNLATLVRNVAFDGYVLLGVGLAAFALEALRWGARRREGGSLAGVVMPALLTLAGVVALVISHDPGRRI